MATWSVAMCQAVQYSAGFLPSGDGRTLPVAGNFADYLRTVRTADQPFFDRLRLRLLDGMNRPTTNSTTMSTRMPMR